MKIQHLTRAPIVEAVIEIRSTSRIKWEEQVLLRSIKERLPEYPKVESQRGYKHTLSISVEKGPHQEVEDLGFNGFKLISDDMLQIIMFRKEQLSFSRLQPYENWEKFLSEALRIWGVYKELSGALAMNRLGVRFINNIALPPGEARFGEFLNSAPEPPGGLDLPFTGFFHQDTLSVPRKNYIINNIRTVQKSPVGSLNVIIDVDIFTGKSYDDDAPLSMILGEMRDLKNTIFFNSITDKTLELLK